jgi:hypothetical protein
MGKGYRFTSDLINQGDKGNLLGCQICGRPQQAKQQYKDPILFQII